jgi:shikimate dehydrogenase
MISLALIGKNISHSRSPQIYRELLKQEIDYKLFDCNEEKDIPSLEQIFERYQGLSITSPYKKYFLNQVTVMPGFGDLNAINAIRKTGQKFEAINTDYLAIDKILDEYEKCKVILLGDGVMSLITEKILKEKGFEFKIFSRKKNGPIENINLIKAFSSDKNRVLIINSCSRNFIFQGTLPPNSIFWDFNYDFPPHNNYIPTGSVSYVDGLGLLKLQAKYALEFFRF